MNESALNEMHYYSMWNFWKVLNEADDDIRMCWKNGVVILVNSGIYITGEENVDIMQYPMYFHSKRWHVILGSTSWIKSCNQPIHCNNFALKLCISLLLLTIRKFPHRYTHTHATFTQLYHRVEDDKYDIAATIIFIIEWIAWRNVRGNGSQAEENNKPRIVTMYKKRKYRVE